MLDFSVSHYVTLIGPLWNLSFLICKMELLLVKIKRDVDENASCIAECYPSVNHALIRAVLGSCLGLGFRSLGSNIPFIERRDYYCGTGVFGGWVKVQMKDDRLPLLAISISDKG